MANTFEPTPEQVQSYAKWVKTRPANVGALAEKFLPWKLYRLTSTGQRVKVISIYETPEGTLKLRIAVTGEFNWVAFDTDVFGIDPNELVECDLPGPGDMVGRSCKTEAEIAAHIQKVRHRMQSAKRDQS